MYRLVLSIGLVLATSLSATAQYDLTTIDGTIEALYESISGPEGFEIDREVFDPLFTEDARLSATFTGQDGNQGYVSWSPAEYIVSRIARSRIPSG